MEQKPKVFNINNFITTESARLTSLSLKRDLSLGGNKQKKVYKPNLNVVRNKNKSKILLNNKSQYNNKRNSKNHSTRNNHSQRYIQSTSVFSEGAGDFKRPKIHTDRYLYNGERDSSAVAMPRVIKRNSEATCKEEKNVVDDLLQDDDSSSESEDEYSPLILPLKCNEAGFLKTYQIKKEDPDNKDVKEEVINGLHSIYRTSDNIIRYDVPLSFQDNKFYDDNHPCISLLRLPDSLPGKGFVEDSDKIIDYDLNQMLGGRIGKVLVRRSGKVEVQIGHMKYILDTIDSNHFKEDIMTVPEDLRSSSFGPDMASLGDIDEKYILCPSWKHIFEIPKIKKS